MFQTFIFIPLYNFLVYLVSIIPGNFMWIAVVILTFLIKILLIPLYKKQIKDQTLLAHMTPKMKDLQEKYKDNKEELSKQMLALYKEYKVNPFTTIFLLIIQFPILIALYQIFLKPISEHYNVVYSFITIPEKINTLFFGIELNQKSVLIVILAVISQYILNLFLFSKKPDASAGEFALAMHTQMKYVLPVVIGFVSFITPAVISLYIVAGNVFMIYQEIFIRRPLEKEINKTLK